MSRAINNSAQIKPGVEIYYVEGVFGRKEMTYHEISHQVVVSEPIRSHFVPTARSFLFAYKFYGGSEIFHHYLNDLRISHGEVPAPCYNLNRVFLTLKDAKSFVDEINSLNFSNPDDQKVFMDNAESYDESYDDLEF